MYAINSKIGEHLQFEIPEIVNSKIFKFWHFEFKYTTVGTAG